MFENILLVAAGGAVGSTLRYLVSLAPFKTLGDVGFPLATLITNVAGSALLALVVALAARANPLDPRLVTFLKVGVCGGFTTFSTFAFETSSLTQTGHSLTAFVYVLLSLSLSLTATCAIDYLFAS